MSTSENKVVLNKLQREIDDFNHSYMLVAGFEQLAVDRVRVICTRTLEVRWRRRRRRQRRRW